MKPPLIWRLEAGDGLGIYQANDIIPDDDKKYRNGNNPKRPGPFLDHIPAMYQPNMIGDFILNSGGYFGFATLEQARRWFDCPDDIREWSAKGLFLSAYRRRDIRRPYVTPHQAVFFFPKDRRPKPAHRWPAAVLYDLEPATLLAQINMEGV